MRPGCAFTPSLASRNVCFTNLAPNILKSDCLCLPGVRRYRRFPFGRIAIGTETEYQSAREKHERAKAPKGGLVGVQPFKSQAHQVRPEGRANDEAGEQIPVQLISVPDARPRLMMPATGERAVSSR